MAEKYEHIGMRPCFLPCQNLPPDKGGERDKPSVVKYAYNSCAQEAEGQDCEFIASLGFIVSCKLQNTN